MRQRHRQETFWYGNFRNQAPDSLTQGWETYDARPRFGTNLLGMRGRFSILSEAYSNAAFRDRVLVTYNFVRELLSLAAEHGENRSLAHCIPRGNVSHPTRSSLRSVLGPPTEQDVIAEITEPAGDGARAVCVPPPHRGVSHHPHAGVSTGLPRLGRKLDPPDICFHRSMATWWISCGARESLSCDFAPDGRGRPKPSPLTA